MFQAAVTGMGVVSSAGLSLESFWDTLKTGRNTVKKIDRFPVDLLPVQICSPIDDNLFIEIFGGTSLTFDTRVYRYTHAALTQALAAAGLDLEDLVGVRVGVVIGSSIGTFATSIVNYVISRAGACTEVPGWGGAGFGSSSNHLLLNEIGDRIKAGSFRYFVSNGCSTGADSVGIASQLVEWGLVDICVALGVEAPIEVATLCSFGMIGALSSANADFACASRPFDKNRDGFVLGEGAGAIILENAGHARKRGARIQAYVKGYATTCDAYHRTAPAPDNHAAVLAIQNALSMAHLHQSDIDCILAHATSTPVGDIVETNVIRKAFGQASDTLTVTAIKAVVGHSSGASGALQAIAGIMMMGKGVVLPTHHLAEPDPQCDLNYAADGPYNKLIRHCMSLSFGFSGKNSVLVLGDADG